MLICYLCPLMEKRIFPELCWHSCNSPWCLPASGSPALPQEIRFLQKTEAGGAALQRMQKAGLLQILLFFDHYCITLCRHNVSASEVGYLHPSQHYFLRLSLTLCLGVWIWWACSALGLRATGFNTLFVHFDYRTSLNELINSWILKGI